MIQATDLRKSYGINVAVDGVSFDIKKGETFGLLGPNGAGKSTTIHMLVGYLKPDSGVVTIDGKPDPTRAENRNSIGIAPQAMAIYDDMTGEENVRFFGSLYGLSGRDLTDRTNWAIDFVGLTDRKDDPSGHYSGGMKRRLNIASAIVADPKVVLLDEPTVGVDPQSRNSIFDNIEKLKTAGKTILYTTHYMEEAQRLCDRVAILDHGKILALDKVNTLIEKHGGKSVVEVQLIPDAPPPALRPGDNREGDLLRIRTDRPHEEVTRLVSQGTNFQSLKIQRSDLESVFLNLTGRRLRD